MNYPTLLIGAGSLLVAHIAIAGQPAARLGAPFPGSSIIEPQAPRHCGLHFKFSTHAGIDQVAGFYLAQGQRDHLTLLSDTVHKLPGYRMIVFSGGATGHFLSVVLDAKPGALQGAVYYVLSRPKGCDARN